jgi:hypothetical protein
MTARTLPLSAAHTATLASLAARRTVALCGEQATTLGTSVATRVATEGRAVKWICGDNQFNPYLVAREAYALQASTEAALSRIQIARAFTAYQLAELVCRLAPAAEPNLVIISGLCTSFLDEDVPATDAARLFYRVLWRTVELAEQGMSLLLVQRPIKVRTSRYYFFQDLCRVAHRVLYLDGRQSFTLRTQLRAGLAGLSQVDQMLKEAHNGQNAHPLQSGVRRFPTTRAEVPPRLAPGRSIDPG